MGTQGFKVLNCTTTWGNHLDRGTIGSRRLGNTQSHLTYLQNSKLFHFFIEILKTEELVMVSAQDLQFGKVHRQQPCL